MTFSFMENIIDNSNSNHHHVYLLNAASDNYSCIKINRLYNVFPLYLRRIDVNGHFLSCVVLKHHIVNLL